MTLTRIADQVEASRADAADREVHDARTASILGVILGVSFLICFLTGMWSHLQQNPPSWLEIPIGPAWAYRVTQGLHIITGLASIPLLLAKLYSVSPKLLSRPPVRSPLHAMERIGLLPLVGGSVFMLATGAANVARWYPFKFFFPVGHFWGAWVLLGATMIHLALKVPVVRRTLGRGGAVTVTSRPLRLGELSRRGLLVAAGGAAALLTLLTAGQTVPFLKRTTLLAPRRPDIGPQGLPVNRTASAAGTEGLGADPSYRLVVSSADGTERSFTLAELQAMSQRTETLPIVCVEGWSAEATWSGVSVADAIRAAGMEPGPVTVRSAQTRGGYRNSDLTGSAVSDERCLLALRINGEPLNADHGAPLRLIAPNRPGVMQTKWVERLELS